MTTAFVRRAICSEPKKGSLLLIQKPLFTADNVCAHVHRSILAGQIFNAMVLVLIIALAVSLGIQSWIEGGVIGAVIVINVVSSCISGSL